MATSIMACSTICEHRERRMMTRPRSAHWDGVEKQVLPRREARCIAWQRGRARAYTRTRETYSDPSGTLRAANCPGKWFGHNQIRQQTGLFSRVFAFWRSRTASVRATGETDCIRERRLKVMFMGAMQASGLRDILWVSVYKLQHAWKREAAIPMEASYSVGARELTWCTA